MADNGKLRLQFPPDKGGQGGQGGQGGYIRYNPTLKQKARANRKTPTPAENKLWFEVLQDKRLGDLKFTRQKPLDEYIVDFYCAKLRLAIEIDGDTHGGREAYDRGRTNRLNELGVTVARYANSDVMGNLEGIYRDLVARIGEITP